MKKISTLFASLILAVAVFAADAKPKSMLTVKSAGQGAIRVVVDGKNFEPNDNSLIIENINSGYHDIKVYRQRNNGIITLFGKKYEMLYNTSVNVNKRTHLLISIDRNGRVNSQEFKLDRNDNYNEQGQWNDHDTHEGYASGMSDREFSRAMQSVQKEWLETNKLKTATQLVRTNNLTAAQVKQLVLLFGFENNKLDLAKQAYANTVDKRNYTMLYDVFSFNNSKTELERYIRSYR